INDWYSTVFAPLVFEHLRTFLISRVLAGVVPEIQSQVPFLSPSTIAGLAQPQVEARINGLLMPHGAEAGAVAVGEMIGGVVSGAMHDLEGGRGFYLASAAHPEPYAALG